MKISYIFLYMFVSAFIPIAAYSEGNCEVFEKSGQVLHKLEFNNAKHPQEAAIVAKMKKKEFDEQTQLFREAGSLAPEHGVDIDVFDLNDDGKPEIIAQYWGMTYGAEVCPYSIFWHKQNERYEEELFEKCA